jgi:HK97 gp10 family phage protein
MAEVKITTSFYQAPEQLNIWNRILFRLSKTIRVDVTNELISGVNNIRNEIILSMRNTKRASHFYYRGGQRHYPSAPFNPPAIDKGELVQSIVMDAKQSIGKEVSVEIGAVGAPYGKYLEDGTKKMKPRPWLAPAVENNYPIITRNIINRIKQGIK